MRNREVVAQLPKLAQLRKTRAALERKNNALYTEAAKLDDILYYLNDATEVFEGVALMCWGAGQGRISAVGHDIKRVAHAYKSANGPGWNVTTEDRGRPRPNDGLFLGLTRKAAIEGAKRYVATGVQPKEG